MISNNIKELWYFAEERVVVVKDRRKASMRWTVLVLIYSQAIEPSEALTTQANAQYGSIRRQKNFLTNTEIFLALWATWSWRYNHNIECFQRLET